MRLHALPDEQRWLRFERHLRRRSPSGAVCARRAGYTGDGITCTELTCAMNNGGCDPHATCAGAGPQLTCTCESGYVASGKGCQPCGTQSCQECNDCGGCASGTLDTCASAVCNASAPADPGSQSCQVCNDCGCASGTTDDCGNGCDAVPPPDVGSSCEACNDCGGCSFGSTDACGDGCDAVAPPDPGSQSCEACNSCGECGFGSSDECGNGCGGATAPDSLLRVRAVPGSALPNPASVRSPSLGAVVPGRLERLSPRMSEAQTAGTEGGALIGPGNADVTCRQTVT